MPVLTSLAAIIAMVEAIATPRALRAALADIGALVNCQACLLVLPHADGSLHTIASPDVPWLRALAPTVVRALGHRTIIFPGGLDWCDGSPEALQKTDRALLHQALGHGLRSAITFPLVGPPALAGNCSFAATKVHRFDPEHRLALAILATSLGAAGRRVTGTSSPRRIALTRRQRDCLLWAARGKTDWEIGHILGVREDTVEHHLRLARERYGVDKRSMLIVRALFDGTVSFEEALSAG